MDIYRLAFRLVLAGAEWHGDTMSSKWEQILYVPPEKEEDIMQELEYWDESMYLYQNGQVLLPAHPLTSEETRGIVASSTDERTTNGSD